MASKKCAIIEEKRVAAAESIAAAAESERKEAQRVRDIEVSTALVNAVPTTATTHSTQMEGAIATRDDHCALTLPGTGGGPEEAT